MDVFESTEGRLKQQWELPVLKVCGWETDLSASSLPSARGLDEKKLPKIRKKQSSFFKSAERRGGNSLETQELQFKIGAYCSALF